MKQKKIRSLAFLTAFLMLLLSLCSCRTNPETGPKPKNLTWAIGTVLPSAEDFFENLGQGDRVSFEKERPFEKLKEGENTVELLLRPAKGKKQHIKATLTLIQDTTPPVIEGLKDLIAYVGEGVAYRNGITVTDNCGGKITLTVDSGAVNTQKEGVYPVIYWATDAAGNCATAEVKLHVYEQEITLEMLFSKIDPLIERLGLKSMNKEQQARAVYRFVHTDAKIMYIDTSDKTSWIREAYFCLESRKGDCFSYFSLSKAFFERLGIENLDVQRTKGYTDDTHYWSMVNISDTEGVSRWYHYDATRLKDFQFTDTLLTDAQVRAFNILRPNFYLYDSLNYPASETTVITDWPDLKPYL